MDSKRRPPAPAGPAPKRFQGPSGHAPPDPEYEDFDEDVFLEDTIMREELHQVEGVQARLVKWSRPPVLITDTQKQSLVFQQLEIDYVIGEALEVGQKQDKNGEPAAVLRMFGVTQEGNSVCCHVHGFQPYFYISCTEGFGPEDIPGFRRTLEERMREANRSNKSRVRQFVTKVELIQKRSLMYFQHEKSKAFLKIFVALPTMVASCRGILEKGIQIDGLGVKCFLTYESNVLFALRFMIDCDIVGGNWIELPASRYCQAVKSMSYCQIEVDVMYPFTRSELGVGSLNSGLNLNVQADHKH